LRPLEFSGTVRKQPRTASSARRIRQGER